MRTGLTPIAFLLATSVSAQWLNYKTPGVPRTPDGKVDLTAPVSRTIDGHPDLSGVWQPTNDYWLDIAADLKPDEIQPWARALYQERSLSMGKDGLRARCLPTNTSFFHALVRIVQTPAVIVLLSESDAENSLSRTIYMDGRGLPTDPNPAWLGYSVGRWENDTLVADSVGFNDQGWLDAYGHPRSEALHITERFHRRNLGHMDLEMTINDPKVFTRAFTVKMNITLAPDTDLLESLCENNWALPHMVGGATVRLAPEILAKYVGTYQVAPGRDVAITAEDYLLFLFPGSNGQKEPLTALSETTFVVRASGDTLEFVKDAKGAVTHFVRQGRAANQTAARKGDLIPRR